MSASGNNSNNNNTPAQQDSSSAAADSANTGNNTPPQQAAAAPASPGEEFFNHIMQSIAAPFANMANAQGAGNGALNNLPSDFRQLRHILDQHLLGQNVGVTAAGDAVRAGGYGFRDGNGDGEEQPRRRRVRAVYSDGRPPRYAREGPEPPTVTAAELEEEGMTYEGIVALEREGVRVVW